MVEGRGEGWWAVKGARAGCDSGGLWIGRAQWLVQGVLALLQLRVVLLLLVAGWMTMDSQTTQVDPRSFPVARAMWLLPQVLALLPLLLVLLLLLAGWMTAHL